MQKLHLNLDREFIKWFYEESYPDINSNRSMVMDHPQSIPTAVSWKDYWMRQAFNQGAKAMWDDINYTLAHYACTVEGLEPEMLEPCEVYDRARESLHYYVNQQLELFK